jgi:phage gpG-like protein
MVDLHTFSEQFEEMTRDLTDFIQDGNPGSVADITGRKAVEFYDKGFINEGFTDESFKPWKEVKRRQNPRKPSSAAARRPILTETGRLRRSLLYAVAPGSVTISAEAFSEKGFNYAPVHNFGTVKVPKREFVAPSQALNAELKEEYEKRIQSIINK